MKTSIEHIRHSFAHLLAAAVLEIYPDAKNTIGPSIENGFYYDFDFGSTKVNDNDLPKIEEKMREILKSWKSFEGEKISAPDARKHFKGNVYKIELIDELEKNNESITLYKSGDFTDLCRGGHVEHIKEMHPKAFKLDKVAGAYWRGSEKNTMLTRIYGFAFTNEKELDEYIKQVEEAKKRDHKKLGKELGLFVFSDLVGSGLPLWTPKGTIMRELLDSYVCQLRKAKGYEKVSIPHITKKDLYETSGHWAKFSEELFKITTREGHEFVIKPMNCPHHTQIFASTQRSYRDMPKRYSETTAVYRDEQSGELAGLSRTRGFTQDDAHVFCRKNQIENEVFAVWDIVDTFYKSFGFELSVRFSRHDPTKFDKYIGTPETWAIAETEMKKIIEKRGIKDYIDGLGEAAMYGPKIDFLAKDSIGRTLQVATIQLDFNMPDRFDLYCINEKSEKERIVMIHAAIMGSIERFMAVIIEHFAGNFPLWLSPVQVKIIPVRENHNDYAEKIASHLKDAGIRVDLDISPDGMGKKVRSAKDEKIPYWIIVGDKDVEADKATLESRDKGQIGQLDLDTITERLSKEIKDKIK